ncbi:RNA-binding KH domain-containing protein [Drosera capensis]
MNSHIIAPPLIFTLVARQPQINSTPQLHNTPTPKHCSSISNPNPKPLMFSAFHPPAPGATITDWEPGTTSDAAAAEKWPGWPGDCVFRMIVPVMKVGALIGRKGELIKKMCEESRARIRVLEGPLGDPDRIVLISGKEELEAPMSPAMDAVIRVFRRVNGLPENADNDNMAGVAFCSCRLLVANPQAISLIGKQGSMIKSIQESTGVSIRVLSGDHDCILAYLLQYFFAFPGLSCELDLSDEMPKYVGEDERIVEMQGEALKVLQALEAVVGHLRKFLVDHSVLPLFEKNYTSTTSQEHQIEPPVDKHSFLAASQTGLGSVYPLPSKRESLFFERELHLDPQINSPGLSAYRQDPGLSTARSSLGLGRPGAPIITQVAQTMQIPLSYAEDIIGTAGQNIAYIRRTSGAVLTVQESKVPDEITVEIKGTSTQVQIAQDLIQQSISNHRGPPPPGSYHELESISNRRGPLYGELETLSHHRGQLPGAYGELDPSLRPPHSQLGSSYPLSSLSSQRYHSYVYHDLGGYSSHRL